MQYSFSTVLMAFLSSNVIIIFTAVCFCNKDLLVSFGYKMFALLLGLSFLRFLLPFQFPFAVNLVFPKILSRAVLVLRHYFSWEGISISIWTILEAVWIIGALVMLVRFLRDQIVFHHRVIWESINVTEDEHYSRLLDEICGDAPNPFCVFELQGVKIPMLYGIFLPRILVPIGMELEEEELRYLLSHETAHHFHHDILIKLGVSLLTVVYWWNPLCHVLKRQLHAILEMRIDDYVAGDTLESRQKYLKCLIDVAEAGSMNDTKKIRIPENTIALFNPHRFNSLTHRFEMMGGKPKPYARFLHVMALVSAAAIYVFSYAFIFEARYVMPEDSEATFALEDPYTYIISNENDIYEVYYGNLLMEEVESLEDYPDGTPVYNSLEEVPPELRVTMH